MWNPLEHDFPHTLHGFRCMLANNYIRELLPRYPYNSVGYSYLRSLLQILRSRNHDEAELRYGVLYPVIRSTPSINLRDTVSSSCTCLSCPKHSQETELDESTGIQETPLLPTLSLS
uniref:Protein V2 n=1 Tax=China bean begomovirus TaxID=403899 RepID=Q06BK8_9GEMI|nr:pre-coat protein [China bean begomovirus]